MLALLQIKAARSPLDLGTPPPSLGASWRKSSVPNPGRQCKVRRSNQRGYRAHDFQNLLIEVTRHHESAFTLFGRLRVDGSNRLDLKKLGLMPISPLPGCCRFAISCIPVRLLTA
jgi:hypothetical protein